MKDVLMDSLVLRCYRPQKGREKSLLALHRNETRQKKPRSGQISSVPKHI